MVDCIIIEMGNEQLFLNLQNCNIIGKFGALQKKYKFYESDSNVAIRAKCYCLLMLVCGC